MASSNPFSLKLYLLLIECMRHILGKRFDLSSRMHNDALEAVVGEHASQQALPRPICLRRICNQATTHQDSRWLQPINPHLKVTWYIPNGNWFFGQFNRVSITHNVDEVDRRTWMVVELSAYKRCACRL